MSFTANANIRVKVSKFNRMKKFLKCNACGDYFTKTLTMMLRSPLLLVWRQHWSFLIDNGHHLWSLRHFRARPPFCQKRENTGRGRLKPRLFSAYTHCFKRWPKDRGLAKMLTRWDKMSSSSVVPVVLWGSTPPSHCISCIITTYDQKTIVTGSTDGQLGIWDLRFALDGEIKVSPYMQFTLASLARGWFNISLGLCTCVTKKMSLFFLGCLIL